MWAVGSDLWVDGREPACVGGIKASPLSLPDSLVQGRAGEKDLVPHSTPCNKQSLYQIPGFEAQPIFFAATPAHDIGPHICRSISLSFAATRAKEAAYSL